MTNQEDNKHRISVSIYGQQYTIVGREDPAHVKEVARIVNEQMREIKRRNPYLDTTQLAVLTAVNAVSEFKKSETKWPKDQDSNEN